MRFLALGSILLVSWLAVSVAAGSGKSKKPEVYALIAGTVFRSTGLSLGGAEVTVTPAGASDKANKHKKASAVADSRGEFAIRVPALPMRYRVTARAPGFQPEEKSVSISGEDRVDVFFKLEAASKK